MANSLVVLVSPGHDDEVEPQVAISHGVISRKHRREPPPISIINLGGFIRDHGYDLVILDTYIEKDYKRRLAELVKEEPLAIGFSVILGKFTKNALTLTKMIKELNGDIPVVWGGKLVHLAKDLIFAEAGVDFLVIGDGEWPFLNLLNCLKEGKDYRKVQGIGYRENGRTVINLNLEPVEKLDSIYISKDFGWDLVKQYINKQQIPYFINLYTGRGCKYNCSFCYLQDIKQLASRIRYRRRSADNIIREIDYLHNTFGINVVTFGDDDFLSNVGDITPVFDYLRRNNIFIEQLATNISNLKPEIIKLLSGICQTVIYSIETATPRLQKILRKSIPPGKVIETNKELRQHGMNTVHNFLFGIPTETDAETKANIDLLKKLKSINPYVRGNSYILSPIPETPIFEFVKALLRIDIKWDLEDLANFHFRYMGKVAYKFRPYLNPEDNTFYETLSELTNDLFRELNSPPTKEQEEIINANKRVGYILGDMHAVNRPAERTPKYILDQVLEAISLGLPMPQIKPF